MEFNISNLVIIIVVMTNLKKYLFNLLIFNLLIKKCLIDKNNIINKNPTNSTGSQFHQPPQFNSCEAHQAPKINPVIKSL